MAPSPADCHHAVPTALCLPAPQTRRQLCAFSRALRAARGADPGRGHEVGMTHTSVCGQPSSPRGSAHPLGGEEQDRGTGTASLTRELFADHVPPGPSRLSCPQRCCATSVASCRGHLPACISPLLLLFTKPSISHCSSCLLSSASRPSLGNESPLCLPTTGRKTITTGQKH